MLYLSVSVSWPFRASTVSMDYTMPHTHTDKGPTHTLTQTQSDKGPSIKDRFDVWLKGGGGLGKPRNSRHLLLFQRNSIIFTEHTGEGGSENLNF